MFAADGPFACCWGGRWCAGAGTGRVTSGCCSPPQSPTTVLSIFTADCWKINHRHDGGGDSDGLLDCGAGGEAEAVQRVPRHSLSATGGQVRRRRAGGDDYRHRLQPELQRGA